MAVPIVPKLNFGKFVWIYVIFIYGVYGTNNEIHNSPNCGELSFAPNLVLMLMYFIIVSSAAYCYGRHRGEYIRETKWYHKLLMWFISYALLYVIMISWIYYNFFHSSDDINYIGINFPWLTLYGIAYICYSTISTITFAYHSNYDRAALIQFVCLLCTVFPLGLAILTFFLFQRSNDIANYKFGLFDINAKIPICLNIDILSLILTVLIIIAFIHHCYVLFNVFYSILTERKYYLTHPNAYRGRVSNLSHSTVGRRSSFNSNYRMSSMNAINSRLSINGKYVYKSEESESEHINDNDNEASNDQEIEINVQIPIYRHQQQQQETTMKKDILHVPIDDNDDNEMIQLNQSVDIRRERSNLAGSVSYDL